MGIWNLLQPPYFCLGFKLIPRVAAIEVKVTTSMVPGSGDVAEEVGRSAGELGLGFTGFWLLGG